MGNIYDFDLSGAYAAAMGIIPTIAWDMPEVHGEKDARRLTGLMSFAVIKFEFPKGTQFPCLPMPTNHGLIYPLSSGDQDTCVTGPEIAEAIRLGAEIKVLKSVRYRTSGLLLAGYVSKLAALRREFPDKDDPRNRAAKLAINSLFGKLGQGLSNRSRNDELFPELQRDEEHEEHIKMPKSSITLPHAASTITGLVRAVLNVLVLEASKLGTVLSATTDGIMVSLPDMPLKEPVMQGKPYLAPPEVLLRACEKHPSVQLLMKGRANIGENPSKWLEVKYAGNEAYTIKTRMNWIGWNGETLHQAVVGFKEDLVTFKELIEVREQRLTRYYTEPRLHTITDIIEGKAQDITMHFQSKVVNVAPDWKRRFETDGTSRPFHILQRMAGYTQICR